MNHTLNLIIEELMKLSKEISDKEIDTVVEYLADLYHLQNKIFVAGAGRSGCVARAFANRLLHLGLCVYMVGDITSPPISADDILFLISGSGKTGSLLSLADKACKEKAKLISITLNENSPIAKRSCARIILPGNSRLADVDDFVSVQPVGSAFEQLAWLCCDAIVIEVRDVCGITNEEMLKHHANLE